VFIECTATDKTKANIVLDTVVTMFSQHCHHPFTIEPVEIIYEGGKKEITPLLATRRVEVKVGGGGGGGNGRALSMVMVVVMSW